MIYEWLFQLSEAMDEFEDRPNHNGTNGMGGPNAARAIMYDPETDDEL